MDSDGYPTEYELKTITTWKPAPGEGFKPLMDYVRERWQYADSGYWQEGGPFYEISTGGWSGNEALVDAMMDNMPFRVICWWETRRGGHYKFEVR